MRPNEKKSQSLPSLCMTVKAIREKYGDTQEQFAHRLSMGSMTISRFERGVAVPADPVTLQKFAAAAKDVDLAAESDQFMDAYREAIGVEMVNRMYPGRLIPGAHAGPSVSFHTLPEWRLLMIGLFAARYDSATAQAIEEVGGPIRAIVDEVLANADSSRGFGAEFFRELEARVRTLMDQRSLKRIPRVIDEQEGR